MKQKLFLCILCVLCLLTACTGPAAAPQETTAVQPPSASGAEAPVQPGTAPPQESAAPAAGDLPASCLLYVDTADQCGPAEAFSAAQPAARASDGVSSVYGVHLPSGDYVDLLQNPGADGVTIEEFTNGAATRDSAARQIVWTGESYHALTITAQNCALPNITPASGGLLRLNLRGECTVETDAGSGIFEGFDGILLTGAGTLRLPSLTCGGGTLPLPALIIEDGVTLLCDDLTLIQNENQPVTLVQHGGTILAERLESDGALVRSGGTLLARCLLAADCTFRDGTALLDWLDGENITLRLSGGTVYLAGPLPDGAAVEGGAGLLTALDLTPGTINTYSATILDGEEAVSRYYQTTFSEDWLPADTSGASWQSLTLDETPDGWFAGTLTLQNAALDTLQPWGALHLHLDGSNTISGELTATSLLLTGSGTLQANALNLWGWGGIHHPTLTLSSGTDVTTNTLSMGSNSGETGSVRLNGGSLAVRGETWLQNADLTMSNGTLHLDGPLNIERGSVTITGGTVYLAEGLWLGDGDVVITGGELVVPGGLDALVCEAGSVRQTGGTVREP